MSTELARREDTLAVGEWQMMKDQATVLVRTGFLPASIKTAEQAMAIMLTGKELGIPPMQALRGVHVIQGTPAIKPELMLALCVKRIPGFKYNFGVCDANSATFVCSRPEMSEPYTSTFTMEDAKRAGLTNNPTWSKYPANMLRWRAVGNALHIVAPDVLVGVYTPEEMGAVVDANGEVIEAPEPVVTVVVDAESATGVDTGPSPEDQVRAEIKNVCKAKRLDAQAFKALVAMALGEEGANLKPSEMDLSQLGRVLDALNA